MRRDIAEADGGVNKFKAGVGALGASLKANAGVAALAAGGALVAFGAKAVAAASDLEESTNAVNKSFGATAEGVLEIGEGAAKSFGLSQAAFNAAAVSFASFAKTVAGDGGDVVGVVEDLTTRAADFASVMNIDVAEASTVFRSGLSGETEPLKKFGIDLSAAAVEAFALSSGLVKSKKEMTEAIKVQARYGLLMQETGQFAGDFADTSDGLANSSRVLGASMTDLSAKLGEQLTPSIATAVGWAIQLLDVIDAITDIPSTPLPGVSDESLRSWEDFNELQQAAAGGNEKAQEAFRNGGKELSIYEDYLGNVSDATRHYEEDVSRLNDATLINAVATKAAAKATNIMSDAEIAAGRQAKIAADKVAELEQSYVNLREELADRSAYLDLQDSFDDVLAKGMAAFDGTEESARDYERAQIDLTTRVLDYAEEIGNIPTDVMTDVQALIDEEKYAEAERRLALFEKIRIARITPETYMPGGGVTVRSGAKIHSGGVVGVGNFASNEVPAVLEKGEMVLTEGQQRAVSAAMSGGTAGSTIYNSITINTGADPEAVVNAIKKYARRNGPGSVAL
jgi:hypothetical protein